MNLGFIFELTKRDFTERYAGSVLGVFWMFLWPLVMIAIYTVVFSRIMGAKLPGISSIYSYSIYLIAGILPWTAFANTVSRASTVFVDKRHLISKIRIYLPRLPVYVVLSETVTFVVAMFLYMIFLLIAGADLTFSAILFVPFVFAVQQIFAYALGFLFATLNVFLRDLRELVNILIQVWFWATPIVYMRTMLPDFVQSLLRLNPATFFIGAYHDIFFYNRLPNFRHLIALTLLGHLVLAVAYVVFKRLEKDVRDFL
jgi:lipopolysaccharide transport system permease protein